MSDELETPGEDDHGHLSDEAGPDEVDGGQQAEAEAAEAAPEALQVAVDAADTVGGASNHSPIAPTPTPVVKAAPPNWVAFNWRSLALWEHRPPVDVVFGINGGAWQGGWIVRAHDADSADIFFAERMVAE